MKFQIILGKIVATRREADKAGEHTVNRASRRELQSTQMFPWEEQDQTEGTDRTAKQ